MEKRIIPWTGGLLLLVLSQFVFGLDNSPSNFAFDIGKAKAAAASVASGSSDIGVPKETSDTIGKLDATGANSDKSLKTLSSSLISGSLRCKAGSTSTVGSLEIKVNACSIQNGYISSLKIQACDKQAVGIYCTDLDYSQPTTFSLSQSQPSTATLSDANLSTEYKLTLTCETTHVCSVTSEHKKRLDVDLDKVTLQAKQMTSDMGENSLYGGIIRMAKSPDYSQTLRTTKYTAVSCFNDQLNEMQTEGKVTSCDGSNEVLVNPPAELLQCTNVEECISSHIEYENYTDICVSNVPLKTVDCITTVPGAYCGGSMVPGKYTCSNKRTMETLECGVLKQVKAEACTKDLTVDVVPGYTETIKSEFRCDKTLEVNVQPGRVETLRTNHTCERTNEIQLVDTVKTINSSTSVIVQTGWTNNSPAPGTTTIHSSLKTGQSIAEYQDIEGWGPLSSDELQDVQLSETMSLDCSLINNVYLVESTPTITNSAALGTGSTTITRMGDTSGSHLLSLAPLTPQYPGYQLSNGVKAHNIVSGHSITYRTQLGNFTSETTATITFNTSWSPIFWSCQNGDISISQMVSTTNVNTQDRLKIGWLSFNINYSGSHYLALHANQKIAIEYKEPKVVETNTCSTYEALVP